MKKILIGAVVLAVLIGAFYAFNAYIYHEKQQATPVEPYRATLSGVQVCLPHTDTTGPQTLECAMGLKTDVGEYYALDFSLMSQLPPEISNGEHFSASGTVTPSTDAWQKYPIEGIFSVTDSVNVTTPPEETPEPVGAGKCYVGGCSSQLCTDRPDMVSTCEWTESYACYKTAACERQATGECGWTESAELTSCLAK